jgi:TusA-related sulfurtransferase
VFVSLLASPLQKRTLKNRSKRLETKIIHKFDLREAITPFAFLKVTQAFRDMKPGEILQVTGDNPKTRKEIFKVLQTVNYTVVDTEEDNNFYCICLRKEN